MGKIRLDTFPDRVFSTESFLNDFFHNRNIPHIPKQAVHLNHIFQGESNQGKTVLHVVKGTIDLLLDTADHIADAVAQVAEISSLNDPGMGSVFIHIQSFDFAHLSFTS